MLWYCLMKVNNGNVRVNECVWKREEERLASRAVWQSPYLMGRVWDNRMENVSMWEYELRMNEWTRKTDWKWWRKISDIQKYDGLLFEFIRNLKYHSTFSVHRERMEFYDMLAVHCTHTVYIIKYKIWNVIHHFWLWQAGKQAYTAEPSATTTTTTKKASKKWQRKCMYNRNSDSL